MVDRNTPIPEDDYRALQRVRARSRVETNKLLWEFRHKKGYSAKALGECLNMTPDQVRARINRGEPDDA